MFLNTTGLSLYQSSPLSFSLNSLQVKIFPILVINSEDFQCTGLTNRDLDLY